MYERSSSFGSVCVESSVAAMREATSAMTQQKAECAQIFSVDDSLDNLFLIEAILESLGEYEVCSFVSPHDAIDAIRRTPPSLLLLDLMMPEMTGAEMLRQLRSDKSLPDFPVIVVTAKDPDQIDLESKSQASDIIIKPFQVDSLLEKVRFQLG